MNESIKVGLEIKDCLIHITGYTGLFAFLFSQFVYKSLDGRFKTSTLGSLGGAAVWRLPLAQGAILETWDRIPRQAPGVWSLLLPLSVSLPLSLSL